VAFEHYKKERERLKEEREKARVEFHVFADREKRKRAKDGVLKNKTVCFSHALELQTPLAKKLLQAAFAQGAHVTFKAEECDAYIHVEGEGGQRLKSALDAKARLFTSEEFEKYLAENSYVPIA
jgi:hypothetical protein